MTSFYKWFLESFPKEKYPEEMHSLLQESTKLAYNAALMEADELCKLYDGKLSPAAVGLKMLRDFSE